jgi:hypothetical protein
MANQTLLRPLGYFFFTLAGSAGAESFLRRGRAPEADYPQIARLTNSSVSASSLPWKNAGVMHATHVEAFFCAFSCAPKGVSCYAR